jgi:hypothetical protein
MLPAVVSVYSALLNKVSLFSSVISSSMHTYIHVLLEHKRCGDQSFEQWVREQAEEMQDSEDTIKA